LKVLLTGASGFVGSHILECLHAHQISTAVLLRKTSSTTFLGTQLERTEVRNGSIEEPESLLRATEGITHVIHCAGRTRALSSSEFYQTNHAGTRHLVDVVNAQATVIERFVHISSLAVCGPATPASPANENSPLRPVSDYGKSKLAGEQEVREKCRVPFTIIRPPAVYGPRDLGFFSMFAAIKRHLRPRPKKGQALSIVYARDLAEAVVNCLTSRVTAGQTYFVASPEVVSGRGMAEEIARQMEGWTIPLPMPAWLLWAICLVQQSLSQLTRRASLLNLQKYAELRAPGWVCSPAKLQAETGFVCQTTLRQGISHTLEWYRREHWL
jgi:nucleoside-diphosphate-sugar epimerase